MLVPCYMIRDATLLVVPGFYAASCSLLRILSSRGGGLSLGRQRLAGDVTTFVGTPLDLCVGVKLDQQ